MGFREWATKSSADRAQERADLKVKWAVGKADRAETREGLKADFAATKAEYAAKKADRAETREGLKADFADTKAQMAAANTQLKEGLAATKSKWDEDRTELEAEREGFRVEHAEKNAARPESFEGVTLTSDSVRYKGQGGSVLGATARVETAADARRRITATRVLAIGIFALAAKKQAGHVYLTVEHSDYEFVVEIPVKKESSAREFAAKINNAAKR